MMARETVVRSGSSLQASSRNGKTADNLAIGRLVIGPDLTRSNSSTSRTDSESSIVSASRQGLHSSRLHGDTSAISDDSNRRIAGVPWSDQTYPPYIDPGVDWNANEEYSSRNVAPSGVTLRPVGSEQLPDFHKHGMEGIQDPELPVWEKTWHPPSGPSASEAYHSTHGNMPESVQQHSRHPQQPLGIPDTAVRAYNHSSTADYHQAYSSVPDHQYQQEYSSWQPANGKYFSGGLPQQEMVLGQSNVQHPPSPTAVPPWAISSQEENVANAGGIYNSNGLPLQYDYPNSHSKPAAGEREELRRSGSGGFDRSSSGTGSGTLSPEVNITGNGHSSSSGGNLSRVNSFELQSVQSSKGPKEKPEGPVRWGAIALEHMDTFVSRSSFDRSENKPKFRSTPSGIQPKQMSTSPLEGQLTARPASSTQDASRLPVRRQLSPSLSSSSKQTTVQPNDGGRTANSSVVQAKNANKSTGVFMKLQQSEGVQQVQQSVHGSPPRPQNSLSSPSHRDGNSMSAPSGPNQSSIAPGATSSVAQPPPSQNQPASRPGSEVAQSEGGSHLPRRSQSDMSLLKTSMQALQITVQGVAHSVEQVTTAHQLQTQTSNSISQELSELRAAVTKLSEGLSDGFTQLAALIRHKDTQQQARLLNLATMYDQDTLVPLPSDLGIIPSNFPATRKVFVDLTPEEVLELLKHYNLQLDPADMRFEYLGRFVGLRWG